MNAQGFKPSNAVRALYEARPYPPVGYLSPFLQRVRWEERPTLNYRAAYGASFGSTLGAKDKPRILVAGCGTFEPVVVALANPTAEILAVDLSERALHRLRWQVRLRGLSSRVRLWRGDLAEIPEGEGNFDFIVSTGVVHHLPNPALGLLSLRERLAERGLLRLMVYSYWGRALLYGAKELAVLCGADSPKAIRKLISTLPPTHPYRVYFHLYSDSSTDTGVADGYLHPCDQPFSAASLRTALSGAGLSLGRFLHSPAGQPEAAERLAAWPEEKGLWERLSVLEAYGELEENFRLFAFREEDKSQASAKNWEWNQALPKRGRLFSRMVGEALEFDQTIAPTAYAETKRQQLLDALFLIPGEKA